MRSSKVFVATPLPPEENGIAHYSADLYSAGTEKSALNLIISQSAARPSAVPRDAKILREFEFMPDELEHPLVVHLANNDGCVHGLDLCLKHPSIVVLHDISMHYLLECYFSAAGFDAYDDVVTKYGGAGAPTLLQNFRRERLGGAYFRNEISLVGAVLSKAKGIIVHSQYAKLRLLREGVSKPIEVIPHFSRPFSGSVEARRADARRKLGFESSDLLVCTFGFPSEAKRLDLVMRSLNAVRNNTREFRFHYVHVGGGSRDGESFGRVAEESGLAGVARMTGYVPDEIFFAYMDAADLVINLRWPSSGETSGPLADALSRGAISVVSDTKYYRELRAPGVRHIDHQQNVLSQLVSIVSEICLMPANHRNELRHENSRIFSSRFDLGKLADLHFMTYDHMWYGF